MRTTTEILLTEVKLTDAQVEAIRIGHEGNDFENPVFFTRDVLLKTAMVVTGEYDSWSPALETITSKQAKHLKRISAYPEHFYSVSLNELISE